MSDYIPIGGYNNYGSTQQQSQRPPVKSVYYPPQQQQSQQQLNNQFPQGQQQQQLPPGAVPVLNTIETPPGVKLVSFQQDVTASIPPELQQQLQQLQQQQPQQAVQQKQNNNVPVYVSSDYAQAGWETAYLQTPVRVVNQQQQQQPAGQGFNQAATGAASNAALEIARSEYEQAMAQVQRAAERLGQLSSGPPPQVQFSGFSQAPGQQGFGGGAQLQQQCQGQQQCLQQPQQQKQVQFGGIQQQQQPRLTPNNSAYRFEQSAPPAGRTFNQPQAESVYIGMPNNMYLATSRPRDYHFQPQRQESNTNVIRTARENASATNLRPSRSEENVRTAILSEEGNVVGVVTYSHPSQAPAQQQQAAGVSGGGTALQGGSSDYHFDALRGLNSAY